tara:strand:+ start:92 stop:997 length:906 start_codon:yes stop_codon:yes gene_type:complete
MENNDSVEIDIKEIFSILLLNKFIILAIVIFSSLVSVYVAIQMPNIYQSSSLLTISNSSASSNSSFSSQLGSLGALAGINVQSDSQDKSTLAINTIKSRHFLSKLISDDIVLANIMASKNFDQDSQKIIYDKTLFDSDTNTWLKNKPSLQIAHKKYIGSILKISKDRKTNYITISVDHVSPIFAEYLLRNIISTLNQFIKSEDLKESIAATEYLNKRLAETSILEVRKSLNNLIESQLKTQMLANVKEDYILRSIDPPFVPEEKYLPQRSIVCITGFFVGLFLAIFLVLMRHYFFIKRKVQ